MYAHTDVTRILKRWGLASKLEEIAGLDKVESVLLCRCKCLFKICPLFSTNPFFADANGETIVRMPGGEENEKRYGAPTYQVHVSFKLLNL